MANTCNTTLWFNFDDERMSERFYDIFRLAGKLAEEKKSKRYGRPELFYGNEMAFLLVVCGCEYGEDKDGNAFLKNTPDFRYRGSISYYGRNGRRVMVQTETAWETMTGVFAVMLEHIGLPFKDGQFEGVDVRYYGEEPGCMYYTTSDADFAEGDIHVNFSIDSDNGISEDTKDTFDSENADENEVHYHSEYNGRKAELLGSMAIACGADVSDKNLIEKYEMSLSDGTAGVSLYLPGLDYLSDRPELLKDVTGLISWIAPGQCGSFSGTGSINFSYQVNIKDMTELMKKHIDPSIETLRQGAEIIMKKYEAVRLYVTYDAGLAITDIDICDWLTWAQGWKPEADAAV